MPHNTVIITLVRENVNILMEYLNVLTVNLFV